MLAGVCWALGVVVSKRLHNRHPVDVFNFTFWQMALGLIVMVPVALASHTRPIDWTPEFIGLTTVAGHRRHRGRMDGLVLRAASRLPAGITSMTSLGIPVIAMLGSALQLGERPARLELTGMVLIGVALGDRIVGHLSASIAKSSL